MVTARQKQSWKSKDEAQRNKGIKTRPEQKKTRKDKSKKQTQKDHWKNKLEGNMEKETTTKVKEGYYDESNLAEKHRI